MSNVEKGMVNNHAIQSGHGYLYNSDVGLRRWRAKRTRLDLTNQILNVPVIGNSITEGYATSDHSATGVKSYFGQLRTYYANKFMDVGYGFMSPTFPTMGAPKIWTYVGAWANFSNAWGANKVNMTTSTLNDTATASFTGNAIDIVCATGPTCGNFSVTIDGGAPVNFNATAANFTDNPSKIFSITGLTDGAHTVVIKNTQAGAFLIFLGAIAKRGTKGVRFHNLGASGMSSDICVDGGTFGAVKTAIDNFSPELTIMAHFCNDFALNVTLAKYRANLIEIITRGQVFGDVLLLPVGNVEGAIAGRTQEQYWNVMMDVAISYDCAVLDIYNFYGAQKQANGGLYARTVLGYQTDNIHPNDYGSLAIANMLIETLESGFH